LLALQDVDEVGYEVHELEVLVHNAGVFKLKGVEEPIAVTCVGLAEMFDEATWMESEPTSLKVERVSEGKKLLAAVQITLPIIPERLITTAKGHKSRVVDGIDAEKRYKQNYIDVAWI
jgi:hypothetical protein